MPPFHPSIKGKQCLTQIVFESYLSAKFQTSFPSQGCCILNSQCCSTPDFLDLLIWQLNSNSIIYKGECFRLAKKRAFLGSQSELVATNHTTSRKSTDFWVYMSTGSSLGTLAWKHGQRWQIGGFPYQECRVPRSASRSEPTQSFQHHGQGHAALFFFFLFRT